MFAYAAEPRMTVALDFRAGRDDPSSTPPRRDITRTEAQTEASPSTVDTSLLARVREGDVDAFERLYRSYFTPLWEFAYRYVRDADIAKDVVQDVLLSLWNRRSSLTGAERIPPYLYVAVRYQAINALRRSSIDRRARDVASAAQPMSAPAPDADVAQADEESAVERALARLSDNARRVLLLRWKHGLSFAEIAESLGISEGAAKVQATRARQALAPYLQQIINGE
jgi:RNA polymerase sigma-70 factor (ECF subfamily)